MTTQKLQILIDAQDKASKKLEGIKGKLAGMQAGMRKVGIAATAMGAAITFAAFQTIKIASAAEETQSKFNVVFRGMEDTMNKWAVGFASNVGRARQDIKAFSAGIADVLKPMGLETELAADMSKKMVQLALDVASFNNRQDADVIHSFTSALTGERESLKTLGIVIGEVDIKAEAYRAGLVKEGEELTSEAKALATINLLYEKSVDAQGDLDRTSHTYANRVKALNAAMKDLKETIGNQLLPVVTPYVKKLVDGVKAVEEWTVKNPEMVRGIVQFTAALGAVLLVLGPLLVMFSLLNPVGLIIMSITLSVIALTAAISFVVFQVRKAIELMKEFGGAKKFLGTIIGGSIGESLVKGSRETGGFIPETGLYQLHKGENVIPANGKSGNTFNFDFSGASIVDKENFIKQITKSLNRGAKLASMGI